MRMSQKLNLIVAACNNRGIGVNGTLPWRLKGDMAFFRRVTKVTKDAGRQNAVIMGRRTWESIPDQFRPLAGRVNVVISRSWTAAPEGAHLARSLDEAVAICSGEQLAQTVEQLFVIGGSSVYELALASTSCARVYLTRVDGEFECDTFLPELDAFGLQFKKMMAVEGVDETEQEENGIRYRYEVYDKV